jgi:hypothetical protein
MSAADLSELDVPDTLDEELWDQPSALTPEEGELALGSRFRPQARTEELDG